MQRHTTWSHDRVVYFFDNLECLVDNGIPHGWDYFHPQQNIAHATHFYKGSFDTHEKNKIS